MPALKAVVLDTNTLVSGLLWDGNEARVIEKTERHEIQIFISHDLLKELEELLNRGKFSEILEGKEYTVERAVAKIALMSTIVKPDHKLNAIKEDPDDNRVLECAAFAGADVIISGDAHLLKLRKYAGIDILTAGNFIKKT